MRVVHDKTAHKVDGEYLPRDSWLAVVACCGCCVALNVIAHSNHRRTPVIYLISSRCGCCRTKRHEERVICEWASNTEAAFARFIFFIFVICRLRRCNNEWLFCRSRQVSNIHIQTHKIVAREFYCGFPRNCASAFACKWQWARFFKRHVCGLNVAPPVVLSWNWQNDCQFIDEGYRCVEMNTLHNYQITKLLLFRFGWNEI